MFGGLSILNLLTQNASGYTDNPLRHDLRRAGHAHTGVYLVLSLVILVMLMKRRCLVFGNDSKNGRSNRCDFNSRCFLSVRSIANCDSPEWIDESHLRWALFLASAVVT
jgi:hypothetical protein